MQKGENLWVQNFLNHTAGGAAANETQPSGGGVVDGVTVCVGVSVGVDVSVGVGV